MDCIIQLKTMEGKNLSSAWTLTKQLLRLKVEDARLVMAERLSILLDSLLFIIIAILLGTCCLGFITFAIVHFLSTVMEPGWAYMIIAAFYAAMIGILIMLRRQLITNPVARLISRLILEKPERHETEKQQDKS